MLQMARERDLRVASSNEAATKTNNKVAARPKDWMGMPQPGVSLDL
jgi:hypothetical protein